MTHLSPQILLGPADAGELLTLQRAAYVSEAMIYDDLTLPPLRQTLDELVAELTEPSVTAIGTRTGSRLVGSVRWQVRGDVAHLGRLMVAPDQQGRGLGRALLEAAHDAITAGTIALFTGDRSARNLALYRSCGFVEQRREQVSGARGTTLTLVHLSRRA